MGFKINIKEFILSILIFLIIPTLIAAECTCDEEDEDRDKSKALRYKIAALVSILVASAIGVCIPLLGKVIPALSPEKDIFFIIKAFAAGVILSTGFIHVLPDAFENLTSPCLNEHPWGDFPFTGFVAMCSCALLWGLLWLILMQLLIFRTIILKKHRHKLRVMAMGQPQMWSMKDMCMFILMHHMVIHMALFLRIHHQNFFVIELYHRYDA
jgi:hypothetical protein